MMHALVNKTVVLSAGERAEALAQAKKNSEDAIAGKSVPASGNDVKKSVYGQDCIFVANGATLCAVGSCILPSWCQLSCHDTFDVCRACSRVLKKRVVMKA
jgi:hypothetical protein